MGQAVPRLDSKQEALADLEVAGKVPLPIPALILVTPATGAALTRKKLATTAVAEGQCPLISYC